MKWQTMGKGWLDTAPGLQSILEYMWEDRAKMTIQQKRGMAYLAYLTLCSSYESILSSAIKYRLESAVSILKHEGLKPTSISKEGGFTETHDSQVFTEAVINLAQRNTERADQLTGLNENYAIVFGKTVKDIIGELEKDVKAAVLLRNIIAHGRAFKMTREVMILENGEFGHYSDSREGQLQPVIQRLSEAGLMPDKPFQGIIDLLCEFEVVKHFRDKMVSAMDLIYNNSNAPWEKLNWIEKYDFPELRM